MTKPQEDAIIRLWQKSGEVESDPPQPRHFIFAELLCDHFLEDICRVACFHCKQGPQVERMSTGQWVHVYAGTGGAVSRAECKMSMVREYYYEPTNQ